LGYKITITADARTAARWQQVAAALRRTYAIPISPVTPIVGLPPAPRAIRITGERLLLDVGRACARPEAASDPSRLFAQLRYGGALSRTSATLRLAASYKTLDTHKKKVLSDELGAGFAFAIASEAFGARDFLDVETAMATRRLRTAAPKSRRPDYFASLGSNRALVLEAKGTQSGSSYAINTQIPSGCDHVARVRPAARVSTTIQARLVVATALEYDDGSLPSEIFIGDPEAHEPYDYRFIDDPEHLLPDIHYARVASLIGDPLLLAASLSPRAPKGTRSQVPAERPPMTTRTIDGVPYDGSGVRVLSPRLEIEFFVGLERRIREALLLRATRIEPIHHRSQGAEVIFDAAERAKAVEADEPLMRLERTSARADDGTVWLTTVRERR
jgi:hypothetical protein